MHSKSRGEELDGAIGRVGVPHLNVADQRALCRTHAARNADDLQRSFRVGRLAIVTPGGVGFEAGVDEVEDGPVAALQRSGESGGRGADDCEGEERDK